MLVSSACKCAIIYLAFVFVSVCSRFLNASAGSFFSPWSWFERDKADSRLMTIRLRNWIFCKQADYTLLLMKVTFIFQKMIFQCAADCLSTARPTARQETHMSDLFGNGGNEILTREFPLTSEDIFLKSSLCLFPSGDIVDTCYLARVDFY